MPCHIALVEDERHIADNYKSALEKLGFDISVFSSRPAAMAQFEQTGLPDMAIIDVGLGEEYEGGFELCRDLRARSATLPIIFLTARDSEIDEVCGLRLGADDYLTKDISITQIVARVNALLRRIQAFAGQSQEEDSSIQRGDLKLDNLKMAASWQASHVDLTLTEFWIVNALAKYPGQVKSRQQLMDAANVVQDDNTITTHIKRIRKKFREIDDNFDKIKTAYGMGYRWSNE